MEMLEIGGWDYMRKMLGDHKQPWFPEITTHQTKFFLRNDGVLYVHHKVGEYGHELFVYPTGAWDKTDIFPDRIEESHYDGEKVTWTRREVSGMIKPVEWTFLTAESACGVLERVGITLNPASIRNCEVNEYGILYYETQADDTAWEIDLSDLKRRHKGLDRGCFWTEWQ